MIMYVILEWCVQLSRFEATDLFKKQNFPVQRTCPAIEYGVGDAAVIFNVVPDWLENFSN